jgi:hypothetical protein
MIRNILLFVIAMTLLAASATAGSIVVNGGFTSGDFTGWTEHDCTTLCTEDPAWTVSGLTLDPGAPGDTGFNADTACVGTGCNDPSTGAFISQTLTTVALQTYTLTFLYDPGGDSGEGTTELEVFWNGTLVPGSQLVNTTPESTWQLYKFSGLVAASTSTVLEFTGREDPSDLYLTDVCVSSDTTCGSVNTSGVPEPASLLLIGGGLLGLGILRFRRKV